MRPSCWIRWSRKPSSRRCASAARRSASCSPTATITGRAIGSHPSSVARFCVRESGLHEFANGPEVEGYAYGDVLAPGITAHEVGSICPDDAALHIQSAPGLLAFADGLIRWDGELTFVPDFLIGDDPEGVKRGIVESLRRLCELEFDALMFAHGEPVTSGGREALREFVESPSSARFSA